MRFAAAIGLGAVLLVILAGIWFMTGMPGSSFSGPLPPLSDREQLIHDNLKRHVAELAGRIGERNVWHPGTLAAAEAYIRKTLEDTGYVVNVQSFPGRGLTVNNLEAVLPGHGAAPGGMEGVFWSDHWSFWQAGYPAIMVTDTAPFRYPHYHVATDTPEQLDYTGLARVTGGLAEVSGALASP